MQRCLAPPSGQTAGRHVSPEECKEGVSGRLSDSLVVATGAFRKVGARPILAAEEEPARDGVVLETQGSDIEHCHIHREPERTAQIPREGRLVLE